MTIAQRIGQLSDNLETRARVAEFMQVARLVTVSGSSIEAKQLARQYRCTDRVIEALETRAAVPPGTVGDSTWGGPLAPYQLLADAFLASLRNVGAFDAALPDMLRVLPQTQVAVTTAGAVALPANEAAIKPASRLSLTAGTVAPMKAPAYVVVSGELLKAGGVGPINLLRAELANVVAHVTDAYFVSVLIAGLTPLSATSGSAAAVRGDLAGLMDSVAIGGDAKLYFLTTSAIAKRLSVAGDASGAAAFPGALPTIGGTLCGLPLLVSDAVAAGNLILFDAAQLHASGGTVELDRSEAATLQLDNAPDSPPISTTLVTSLWQANLVALRAERIFGVSRPRAASVAVLGGVFGTSP
jgi:Phage capsid family